MNIEKVNDAPISVQRPNFAVALVCACLLALLPIAVAGDKDDEAKMSKRVEAHAKSNKPDFVDVIVTYDTRPDVEEGGRVTGLGGKVVREYRHLPMMMLRVPEMAIHGLAKGNGVRHISVDTPVRGFSLSAKETAVLPEPGSTSYVAVDPRVAVAVVDSGVASHPDLTVGHRVDIVPAYAPCKESSEERGLSALYRFQGAGSVVRDVSQFGDPLDLDAEDPSLVVWESDGLKLGSATRLSNPQDGNKIFDACTSSNEITVEVWVTPDSTRQTGPARIVTLSVDPYNRNFTLGQNDNRYQFRLRTTTNGLNGTSTKLESAYGSVALDRQHVVFTRDAGGTASLYLDGVLVDSAYIGGDLSNWNPAYDLGLGNEFSTGSTTTARDWVGTYEMAAVYCEAHTSADVWQNYLAGSTDPSPLQCDDAYDDSDPWGHGTHVAGAIAGTGSASFGWYSGIAPGAAVHSVRVLDDDGRGVTSDVIAGLDWILGNASARDIRVVNLSLGKGVEESAAHDPLVQAVEALWDAGIVVVASAGNYGRDGNFTITSPGNSPKVITVGSLTDGGTGSDVTDDYVSTYSSRGPSMYDLYLKPDLVAPGNRFMAPIPVASGLKTALPDRTPTCGSDCSGLYLELSGTSMAAAVVSGTATLMLSDDTTLAPATIKARLMRSARKISEDPTAAGAGVLDISAALVETGYASVAPSPRMARSDEGPVVLFEDTAQLWGGTEWSAAYLWADAYLWSDAYLWADAYLWGDAYLWADAVRDQEPLFDPSAAAANLQDD